MRLNFRYVKWWVKNLFRRNPPKKQFVAMRASTRDNIRGDYGIR